MSSSNKQPMVVYPHSMSQHSSSISKGSFGPVFVVLAVVAALTIIACFVGQVCARRYLRPRHRRDHAPYQSDGDIEGGIQMRTSPSTSTSAAAPGQAAGGGKGRGKPSKAKHGKSGGIKQNVNPAAVGDEGSAH